ncbi:hypothetical protein DFH29DRAFT_956597 [Suillus ampliporus]|nr:hypothetical protein DFH29DRAFT_956597 [Suillus ampliporus]
MPVVVNAMLGVIMMTWIHAMYQRSKKIFIFLVAVLLASTIATRVMTGIGIDKSISVWDSYTDTRGAHAFRHPSVFFCPSCGRPMSDFRNLDTYLYMGDPRIVLRSGLLQSTFSNCDNR